MNGLREKFRNKKGFTLIEMLIVVAIIAILIAVSIPLVNGALENARDATDQANERAAKAEITLIYMGVEKNPANADYVSGQATGDLYYDAVTGKMEKDAPTTGYGKCTATGKGNKDYCKTGTGVTAHTDQVIKISMDADAVVTIAWVAKGTTPATP